MISRLKILLTAQVILVRFVQAGTTGILEGTIKDKTTGEPIVGASVIVVGTLFGASSGGNGYYQIANLRAGVYDIRFSAVGHQPVIYRDITIVPDLRTKLSVLLLASDIELNAIKVLAEKPLVQQDITATLYSVTDVKIDRLPVNSLQDIVTLQPGVTREGNVRGGRGTEVLYLVDGFAVQDVIGGGAGSDLPKSSIVEMTIQTGGFDAEYGNALSGVVNAVTKSGGNSHRFSVRADNDQLATGNQTSKTTEVELSASGPIRKDNIFYFFSNDVFLSDTRWWQDFRYYFSSPVMTDINGFGKLDFHFTPTTKLAAQALYSLRKWRDYEFSWRFNLDGLPARQRDSHHAAIVWSQTLSPNAFYTLSLSQYYLRSEIGEGDRSSIDTTPYEYDFFLKYVVQGKRAWRATSRQSMYTVKGDYTAQLSLSHLFKAGFEVNLYDVMGDILKIEPQKTFYGKPLPDAPPLNFSSAYRYFPRTGSAYIQSKIQTEEDGALLNIGLRFDFLDPRASRPALELVPKANDEFEEQVSGFVPAKFKSRVSPRFGFSCPVSKKSFLFANFGFYFQYPLFDYLYTGLNPVLISTSVPALVGNPDLEPETTKMWEISFKHILPYDIVATATYFSKETDNLIDTKTFVPSKARFAGDYGFAEYVNIPSANAHGLEVVISKERAGPITGTLSYTYMEAKGLSEGASAGTDYFQWGFPVPTTEYYLSWDQRHTIKAIGTFELPWGLVMNVVWQFHTGRPYTYYPSTDGFTPDDTTISFIPNNRRMKANSVLDLKIEKEISLDAERTRSLYVYADIRNALNDRNVRWVDANGRVGGELGDPSAYYEPRRTRIGLRVEF
jgi:outer membrane receptor for ferrienterochelin and colicin